jgi:hypothetical protein
MDRRLPAREYDCKQAGSLRSIGEAYIRVVDDKVREEFAKYQDSNGVDLARLRRNLRLTPDERLEQHYRAALSVLECMRAAEAARSDKPGQSS